MKWPQYLLALAWPLAIWLLVTVLGAACNLFALQHLQASRQHVLQGHARIVQQQAHTRQALQQAQVHRLYQQHASHWQEIGLSDPANPDAWRDAIYHMQQSSGLPHVRYVLKSTQLDASKDWPTSHLPAPLALQTTPVALFISGEHEGAALQWLQQLHTHYAEALIIRRCEWVVSEDQQTIEAQCLLHWIHLPFALHEAGHRS